MVAQDVHGVLPVPAGAAVVLEAGLGNGHLLKNYWKQVDGWNRKDKKKPSVKTCLVSAKEGSWLAAAHLAHGVLQIWVNLNLGKKHHYAARTQVNMHSD